jgi:hypothetical protein
MNQAHDILRRLFEAMEVPRTRKASEIWDEAREFLRRPASPDAADALAYMFAGTTTGRWPEPRRIGKSPLLAMPYDNPRRMTAEDLTWAGGPSYDALVELERRDWRRKADIYMQMAQALKLGQIEIPKDLFLGLDLAKDFKQEIDDVTGISDVVKKCPKCGMTVMPGSDNPKGWCYLHKPEPRNG